MLRAEELSVGYGRKVVVSGVSFEVKAGEVISIIGPNGAGKSTILKTIASQLPLLSGKVHIGEKIISEMSEKELSRKMSLMLTERINSEMMTCYDIAATGRYPYTGMFGILEKEDREIVEESMSLNGISYLRDVDFRNISDGQRQCVMLARAIAQEPEVMLLDEPTSFLDIDHKLELLTLLRKLARDKQIAVVMTIHELDLAQRFSDKVLCIKDAKADKYGTPELVFSGNYINDLYSIKNGTFEPLYGSSEPKRVEGTPDVFVIGGGGCGIPVYHKLQREGIPFAAGIIHENDIDYPLAKHLAAELVSERAYEPISEQNYNKALEMMRVCSKVIFCTEKIGAMNRKNLLLKETAEKEGKIVILPHEI